jgi:hypothetical protein
MTRAEMRLRISMLEGQNSLLRVKIARIEAGECVCGAAVPEDVVDLALSANDEANDLVPQDIRDRNAAGAFVRFKGNAARALVDLGYDIVPMSAADRGRLAERVFGTPAVRALLQDARASLDVAKESLIGRQVEEALYGDGEAASRAFALLARVGGWFKPSEVNVRSRTVSVHSILGSNDQGAIMAALESIGSHEPGAPVKAGVLGAARPDTIDASE